MLVTILYGDSQSLLLNANCACRNFVDYVKNACKFDFDAIIDLCDESGNLVYLPNKPFMECLANSVLPRSVYIPIMMEIKRVNEKVIKNFVPLLSEWQRKYPSLEKKLKNQLEKGRRPEESPPKTNKKDKTIKDGSSGEIPKRASSNKVSNKKK